MNGMHTKVAPLSGSGSNRHGQVSRRQHRDREMAAAWPSGERSHVGQHDRTVALQSLLRLLPDSNATLGAAAFPRSAPPALPRDPRDEAFWVLDLG